MLIEVHIIQNHAPSNLNRDDSGTPKSAIFGGYRRARISSQCLKRCYRTSATFRSEVDDLGMHTTSMPSEVARRALTMAVIKEGDLERVKKALAGVVKKGEGGKAERADVAEYEITKVQKKEPKTAQSVFWRDRELQALAEAVAAWSKGDTSKSFDPEAALKPAGLSWAGIPVDMALFGRMVTSELIHNVEASCQFAHALSTHEWAREFDSWTRVDDRRDKRLDYYREAFGAGEELPPGTDGMGDAEFTSACYYSYFNVNFEALTDNLTGKALKHDLDDSADRPGAHKRARDAVIGLLKAAIFERPTGKFNSMATPSLPTLVLVEIRDTHVAVSYANAFAKPVDPKNEETQRENGQIERIDLPGESAKRLVQEANLITKAFNRGAKARYLFTGGRDIGVSLDESPVPAKVVVSVDDLVKLTRKDLACPE